MTKTISFKDLVKMIHPDHNPRIENPGEKMEEATRHMEDEQTLYRLAVKWQLIEDDNTSQTDIEFKIREGMSLQKQDTSCIILDSYWQNKKLTVILYNKNTGKYEKHQCVDEWDQNDDFIVDGVYMGEDYIDIDYRYQILKSGG